MRLVSAVYDTAPGCADGDVRAVDDTGNVAWAASGTPVTPEVYYNGSWYPICGHYFWDDDQGATNFCQKLGATSGSVSPPNKDASGTGTSTLNPPELGQTAMHVGLCGKGQAMPECNEKGNHWGDLKQAGCQKGSPARMTVTCSRNDETPTKTTSCGAGKHFRTSCCSSDSVLVARHPAPCPACSNVFARANFLLI